jgi:hypothetical protein
MVKKIIFKPYFQLQYQTKNAEKLSAFFEILTPGTAKFTSRYSPLTIHD